MFYSLFVFRLCYKIIGLSSLNLAGRAGPGLGQTFTVWVGPGPGLGLNSSLRAWDGPGLKNYCGPGPGLDSNC